MYQQSYRSRSRMSFSKVMTIIVIAAVALLVATVVVAYLFGVRYISSETGDGLTVRFFGIVKDDGSPSAGVIRYYDGNSSKVNSEAGTLDYSS